MINRLSFFIKYPKAFFSIIYYKLSFGKYGSNSYILKPMSIDNPRAIYIGDNVLIQQYVWLAACSCDHTPIQDPSPIMILLILLIFCSIIGFVTSSKECLASPI